MRQIITMRDSFLGTLVFKGFVFDVEYKNKLINYLIRERPRSESSN